MTLERTHRITQITKITAHIMNLIKCVQLASAMRPIRICSSWLRKMGTIRPRIPQISIQPVEALVDEKTKYFVNGLDSEMKVTLAAVLSEGPATFISHAHYKADASGNVDVSKLPSSGGSYEGIEPMGLIWAMLPEKGSRSGIRLTKKDVTNPFDIHLYLLPGHLNIKSTLDIQSEKVLCTVEHRRMYMAPGVRRIPVRENRLRGTLFLPKGDGPFLGVIDLFGTAGGLIEFRSALLASRGYASFALAYFAYEDLPKTQIWDMEYFEEAVDWFASHPDIKKTGIGTIGVSKGSELITYMAIEKPIVKAVVCISGYHCYTWAEQYKNGVLQPVMMPEMQYMITDDPEGLIIEEGYWKSKVPEDSIVPLERAEGAEFLFVYGEDDRCTKIEHMYKMIDRLKQHGKANFNTLQYPGTGHLIEPPYTPHSRTAYHKVIGMEMLFGGYTKPHAYAQEDSWKKILEFFDRRLDGKPKMKQPNLESKL